MTTEPEVSDDEADEDAPPAITTGDPEWLIYEKDVHLSLAELDPNATVTHNDNRTGISGRKRQLDALIVGELCKVKVEIAVEAKRYSKKVGIGVVDAFIGKCLDVGVDQGILYSHKGFGAGATARAAAAKHPKILLRELPEPASTALTGADIEELLTAVESWDVVMPQFLSVQDCPGDECFGQFVAEEDWDGGICDQCGHPIGMCQACESATRLEFDEQKCDHCDSGAFDVEREMGSGAVTRIHWMAGLWDH